MVKGQTHTLEQESAIDCVDCQIPQQGFSRYMMLPDARNVDFRPGDSGKELRKPRGFRPAGCWHHIAIK